MIRKIIIVESQAGCLGEFLVESQESKSISAAKRLVMQRLGYNEQQADEFVRVKLRNDIPALSEPNGAKFILGAARMYCDGQLTNSRAINDLNKTLELVASDTHINEYDRNLNGLSAKQLIDRFAKVMDDNFEAEKGEVEQMVFDAPSNYEIVRIDSFEDATRYGDYTSWCVTHDKRMFDSYTNDGINQFYFCLKPNFKMIKRVKGETYPSDEYGLSMIAVSVDDKGWLHTCTCRWNHGDNNDGACNDKFIKNMKGLAQFFGFNPFEVFKPNGKWQELINNAMQRLANGESPQDVFDDCGNFREGFAKVKLNNKYNFIDKNGNLLCDQWFDYCLRFYGGFGMVTLNNKWNYIDKSGNILSKQWFDSCDDFLEGFGMVTLNGKCNYIDKNGNILSKQWFDSCDDFLEGFGMVTLNNKYNYIDKNGNILSKQWFDSCGNFREGSAKVELDGKYNFIDKNGKLLSDQWFSYGFVRAKINGKVYEVDMDGNLLPLQFKVED